MTNSYEKGYAQGVFYATMRYSGDPIKNYDGTAQEEKDFCLFSCPHMDNCRACDRCDGRGNLRRSGGRPRKNINVTEIVILRETMTIPEICRHLGVGKGTIYRAIGSMT